MIFRTDIHNLHARTLSIPDQEKLLKNVNSGIT